MIQRLIKRLKGSEGYTLTEMTAVVATSAVLIGVMLPVAVGQVQNARITSASGDIRGISSAVSTILNDTQDYPMRSGATQAVDVRYARTILYSTDEDEIFDRPENMSLFGGSGGADTKAAFASHEDSFTPHFYTNEVSSTSPVTTTKLYAGVEKVQWKGPYLTSKKLDPWGKSYVIFLRPVAFAADATGGLSGSIEENIMVFSAGPNRIVNTGPTATSPGGDDLVQILAGATGTGTTSEAGEGTERD